VIPRATARGFAYFVPGRSRHLASVLRGLRMSDTRERRTIEVKWRLPSTSGRVENTVSVPAGTYRHDENAYTVMS
jgi:hypothetical protein